MQITAPLGENADATKSGFDSVEGNGNRRLKDSSLQRYLIGVNITGMTFLASAQLKAEGR